MQLYSNIPYGDTSLALEIGKAGEHLVCADLILHGFRAFLSDQGLPYDIIIDINNRLLRVQVKTTLQSTYIPQRRQNYKSYLFHCRRCGRNGRREYTNDEIDIVAFVCVEDNLIGYLNIENVKTTMCFRAKEQKYFSPKQGIYLEDCTFDKVLGNIKDLNVTKGINDNYNNLIKERVSESHKKPRLF